MSEFVLSTIRKVFWCPTYAYDDMDDFQDPDANLQKLKQVLEHTHHPNLPLHGFGGEISYYGKDKYSDAQRVEIYHLLMQHGADPYQDVHMGHIDDYRPIGDFHGNHYNYLFHLAVQMKEKLSVLEQAGMNLCHVDRHGNTLLDMVVSDVRNCYMMFQDELFDKTEWRNTFLDIVDYDPHHRLFYLCHVDDNNIVQCLVKAIRRDFQYGFSFSEKLLQSGADPTQGNTWNASQQELALIEKQALRSKLGNCQNILKKKGKKQQEEERSKDLRILMKLRWVRIQLDKTATSFSRGLWLSKLYSYPDRHEIYPDSILFPVVHRLNADMFQELLTFF